MTHTMYLLISIKYFCQCICKNVVKMICCCYCRTYMHVLACVHMQYICVRVYVLCEVQFLVAGFVVV